MLQFALLVVSASAIREIKVYSYSGPGAGIADIDNQHKCFNKDLVPGWQFRGTKHSGRITAEALKGYDVLLMPGGSPGSELSHTDRDAVRNFVKNGGGYYGTCAGAMAGCSTYGADPITGQIWDSANSSVKVASVGTDENGMPIYPDSAGLGLSSARCGSYGGVGATQNELTSAGKSAFPNQPSVVTIDHHNGPAMEPNSATVLATFKGGPRSGKASIVGDTYGKGKVVLVSPHPEHPDGTSGVMQNCDIIAYIALYAAGGSPAHKDWDEWKKAHSRIYKDETEETYRHSVFKKNVAAADARNEVEPYATFGTDHMSDWTEEEFNGLLGYIPDNAVIEEADFTPVDVPDSKDWTGKATTPIKNQGSCGSCWAFSAVEQVESDYILQHGSTITLAPQELVDCKADKSERHGCSGGSTSGAFSVIESLGGLEAESDYPYKHTDQTCHFEKSKAKVAVTSYQSVGKGDETKMKSYVGSTGPLSVCGYASTWHSYKGGVMTSCGSSGGHCFQIVGYGSDKGLDYWKVRNSWGSSWGESGHLRIQRDKNLCSIATHASPSKVVVKDTEDNIVV